ncbi:L-2-hydroxyglutarate oxidase [soil metagenome]
MSQPGNGADVVVVGGGIVGLAVARELLRRNEGMKLTVLEREGRLATHQTGRSSGVIHAGIYYAPGSLKARLCVEGAHDLYTYCDERGIDARRSGKLIVATSEPELPRLDELERRGTANGVPGLRRLGADEIPEVEPHVRGLAALHSAETGVVDFPLVTESFAADVKAAGGAIETGREVTGLDASGGSIEVALRGDGGGSISAGHAVLCAGAWADRLAVAAGAPDDPRIVPFRGGYLKLRPERDSLVRSNVYPVPDPDLPFLGAHLTRTHAGEVLLGPSALLTGGLGWPGTWRVMRRFWRTGATEIRRAASKRSFVAEARRFVPELSASDFVAGPSGVRAQAVGRDGSLVDDFVVHQTERALHVRNAPSPAATSALALARLIADRVEEAG